MHIKSGSYDVGIAIPFMKLIKAKAQILAISAHPHQGNGAFFHSLSLATCNNLNALFPSHGGSLSEQNSSPAKLHFAAVANQYQEA